MHQAVPKISSSDFISRGIRTASVDHLNVLDGVLDARLRCKGKLGVLEVEDEPRIHIHLLQCADDGSASRLHGKARDPPLLLVIHHHEQLLRRLESK